MKDCRNCAHGRYNDHFNTWFCYHNCECNDWDLWEAIPCERHFKMSYEDEKTIFARPHGEWRLCKDEMPNEDEDVIVSVCDDSTDHAYYYTTVAWTIDGIWICDNELLQGKAIAWQPLPKPYKGDDSK